MKTAMIPAFNPGTTVQFQYGNSDEARTVVYESMRASASGPNGRTWLLVGRDGLRGGAYRSFHVGKIHKLIIVG